MCVCICIYVYITCEYLILKENRVGTEDHVDVTVKILENIFVISEA